MSEYRLIDLSEWEKSGAGANSESFLNDDKTQMLKSFTLLHATPSYSPATHGKFVNERLEIYNLLDLLSRNYRQPGLISDLVTLILVKPQLKKYFK